MFTVADRGPARARTRPSLQWTGARGLRESRRPGPVPRAPGAGPDGPGTGAFFDVDNTIIRGASAFHLAKGLYLRGFFRKRDLLRFGLHQVRYLTFGENKEQIDEVRQRALEIMTGHSVAEVTAIAEDVYDEVLLLRIYPGTQRLLDEHIAAGHSVWLVTATPREIGEIIARRLGATGALGTVAEHKDGYYTGRLVGDMLHGAPRPRRSARSPRPTGSTWRSPTPTATRPTTCRSCPRSASRARSTPTGACAGTPPRSAGPSASSAPAAATRAAAPPSSAWPAWPGRSASSPAPCVRSWRGSRDA